MTGSCSEHLKRNPGWEILSGALSSTLLRSEEAAAAVDGSEQAALQNLDAAAAALGQASPAGPGGTRPPGPTLRSIWRREKQWGAPHRSPFCAMSMKDKDGDELGRKQRITPYPDLLCNVVYASPARGKLPPP